MPRAGAVLAEGEEPGLEAYGYYAPPRSTFSSGCHAAVVEVDVATGDLAFLQYVVQHDCGTLVNPTIVEGQIQGGVAQGVGGAFYERMPYDAAGQPLAASFMDFLMPTARGGPPIAIVHTETPSPLNPLGVKGAGEAGGIPPAAPPGGTIQGAAAAADVAAPRRPAGP